MAGIRRAAIGRVRLTLGSGITQLGSLFYLAVESSKTAVGNFSALELSITHVEAFEPSVAEFKYCAPMPISHWRRKAAARTSLAGSLVLTRPDQTITVQTTYELNVGDHVYVPHRGYNHHGLYIGDGTIARYSWHSDSDTTGRVELVSLEQFSQGERVNVRTYSSRRFGRTMSVSRALMRLNPKFSNVELNDCEHFVTWCIKGLHWNKRAENAIYEAASYELYRLSAPVLKAAKALELHAEEVISKATRALVQRIATTMTRFAAKALEHSALKGASQLLNKGLAAVAKFTGVTMTGPQFAVAVAAFATWQLFDTVTGIEGGSSIPTYIKEVVSNVITKVVETAKGFLRRAMDAIKSLGTEAWSGVRNAIGGFFHWAFDKLAFW